MTGKDVSMVESVKLFPGVEEYGHDWIMTGSLVLRAVQTHRRCSINADRLTECMDSHFAIHLHKLRVVLAAFEGH